MAKYDSKAREMRGRILELAATGMMQKDIAAQVGVERSVVCRIINGKVAKQHEPPAGNWKQHGSYLVADDGRVFGLAQGILLKPDIDKDGYRIVTLSGRKIKLHRLVLTVWDRPPQPGELARHNSNDPSNNHINNLRWGTYSDNEKDKRRHGTANRHHTHPESRFTMEEVAALRREFSEKEPHLTQTRTKKRWCEEKANKHGVSGGSVWKLVMHKTYAGEYNE